MLKSIVSSQLELKATELRLCALETALAGKKGHIPPAYSWADIAAVLYYGGVLRYDAMRPKWEGRDRLLLSKGHACLTLYAALSDLGFFSKEELRGFAGCGTLLPGHPDFEIPGVENASGSLGHGLGVGAGMALAAQLDSADWRTFVILGDGECQEGSIWESAMFAGHRKLYNLIAVVDANGLGATDYTCNYNSFEPAIDRFTSFGWDAIEHDGHDHLGLQTILRHARDRDTGKPFALIARTIKGKGVDFMENSPLWHHRMPKGEEIAQARAQLEARIARLLEGVKRA
ncbi:MAG: transketolase [Proteobacteria bacterium]|nr:transketolase [Pseudomonadota bacterium]